MALKGKKKSRSRGSQARRRPAAAPRPVIGAGRRVPWYRTTGGRALAVILVVALAGGLVAYAAAANSRSAEQEERQEALEDYTSEVSAMIQELGPAAGEMASAASLKPKRLARESQAWATAFQGGQARLAQIRPPEDLAVVNSLFLQSITIYTTAAETFGVVPAIEGNPAENLKSKAATQWTSANGVFESAIQVLDDEREEVDLEVSGLQPPGLGASPTEPQTTDTIEIPGDQDQGAGRDGRRRGKGGRGSRRGRAGSNDGKGED